MLYTAVKNKVRPLDMVETKRLLSSGNSRAKASRPARESAQTVTARLTCWRRRPACPKLEILGTTDKAVSLSNKAPHNLGLCGVFLKIYSLSRAVSHNCKLRYDVASRSHDSLPRHTCGFAVTQPHSFGNDKAMM